MAKDTRKIIRGVTMPQNPFRTYVEGDEDELETLITSEQLQRLEETGSVQGDWNPKGKPFKMDSAKPDKKPPSPLPTSSGKTKGKLDDMTAPQLREIAQREGVSVKPNATKEETIAAIEAARAK